MKGQNGDPRLVENLYDLGWRCLTIYVKNPKHPNNLLIDQYQRYALREQRKPDLVDSDN